MAKFVALKDTGGSAMYVNPDQVVAIEDGGAGTTILRTIMPATGDSAIRLYVQGKPEDVAAKLEG